MALFGQKFVLQCKKIHPRCIRSHSSPWLPHFRPNIIGRSTQFLIGGAQAFGSNRTRDLLQLSVWHVCIRTLRVGKFGGFAFPFKCLVFFDCCWFISLFVCLLFFFVFLSFFSPPAPRFFFFFFLSFFFFRFSSLLFDLLVFLVPLSRSAKLCSRPRPVLRSRLGSRQDLVRCPLGRLVFLGITWWFGGFAFFSLSAC